MKQPIKNIISIVLLVFYLAGFCGVHLLKHSCNSCEHSSIQLVQDSSIEHSSHDCSCNHHTNSCCDQSIEKEQNSICCDYELVYLKSNPTTTLTKQSKAPLINENTLFIQQNFTFISFQKETINTKHTKLYLLKNSDTDLNLLCTYRC